MDLLQAELAALLQVIVIDVVLAGDNAIVVGLAASRVAPSLRRQLTDLGRVDVHDEHVVRAGERDAPPVG